MVQVTSLLPALTASALEHVTSTTVPGFTGNCVVVSIVLVHSVFNPLHIVAVEVIQWVTINFMLVVTLKLYFSSF